MLGCPKLEEIVIINGRNSNVCMWGNFNGMRNISCLLLFPYFGATLNLVARSLSHLGMSTGWVGYG